MADSGPTYAEMQNGDEERFSAAVQDAIDDRDTAQLDVEYAQQVALDPSLASRPPDHARLNAEPEPIKETFDVTLDNRYQAAAWVQATAAHYEKPVDVSVTNKNAVAIREPLAGVTTVARPGDTLHYAEGTGFYARGKQAGEQQATPTPAMSAWAQSARELQASQGTPAEAAAFEVHKANSAVLAREYISAHPVPDDDALLSQGAHGAEFQGLPLDHPASAWEIRMLEQSKASHPSAATFSGQNGLSAAMPQGMGSDVTALARGAKLN